MEPPIPTPPSFMSPNGGSRAVVKPMFTPPIYSSLRSTPMARLICWLSGRSKDRTHRERQTYPRFMKSVITKSLHQGSACLAFPEAFSGQILFYVETDARALACCYPPPLPRDSFSWPPHVTLIRPRSDPSSTVWAANRTLLPRYSFTGPGVSAASIFTNSYKLAAM